MNKKLVQRLLIVAAIIAVVILFKVLGLGQYLSLEYLKTSQDKFVQLYAGHRLTVIATYMAVVPSGPPLPVLLPAFSCATGCRTSSAKNSLQ